MEILFEDKNIVCAVKDAGVPSQPAVDRSDDMTKLLSDACGCEIFCVHRLDRATAGVMVYAKNSKSAGRLSQTLAQGEKRYLAVVCGETDDEGYLEDILWHDSRTNKSFAVKSMRKGAKQASLSYKTLDRQNGKSLVAVTLHTGRTHQIRVQFSSRGYPLAGDGKYGAKDNLPLALFCFSLSFIHPYTGEKINLCRMPDFSRYGFEKINI